MLAFREWHMLCSAHAMITSQLSPKKLVLPVALACLAISGSAFAQPGVVIAADPAPAPAAAPAARPPQTPSEEEATTFEPGDDPKEARFNDANSDHVILGSTAETHPKGTFFFSDYEIILLQFGYAVTDNLQLSITGVPPIVKEQPFWFDFSLKLNVVRTEVFRAALMAGFDLVVDGKSSSKAYVGGHLAAVGQFCFETKCRSSVSPNVGTFLNNQSNSVLPIYGTLGLTIGTGTVVSVLVEPGVVGVVGTGQFAGASAAVGVIDYGIRLSGKNFGADIAFIRPFSGDTGLILGVPWLALTYRTDGSERGRVPVAASAASAGILR
jgi:hypothetical protein